MATLSPRIKVRQLDQPRVTALLKPVMPVDLLALVAVLSHLDDPELEL